MFTFRSCKLHDLTLAALAFFLHTFFPPIAATETVYHDLIIMRQTPYGLVKEHQGKCMYDELYCPGMLLDCFGRSYENISQECFCNKAEPCWSWAWAVASARAGNSFHLLMLDVYSKPPLNA